MVERGRHRATPRVDYEIRLPREADLELDLDRVAATVRGVEGTIALHLDRSDLAAHDLTGKIRIDSDREHRGRASARVVASWTSNAATPRCPMSGIASDSRVAIERGNLDLELVTPQAVTDVSRRARVIRDLPGATEHSARRWSINGGGPELKIAADRGHVRLRSN